MRSKSQWIQKLFLVTFILSAGLSSLTVFGYVPKNLPLLKNWGLSGTSPSGIKATEAWKIEEGSRNVIVAVIDTGIDPNHKDLAKNVWQDPKQKGQKVFGWNFVSNKANPMDENGHGTHVSGIIGALSNPEAGVSGVVHHVSIMAVKYYSDANSGSVNLMNTVRAINYAIDHGAKIINYSGGGPEFSEEEFLAIRRAQERGILFVSAAGNEHQNTDKAENYYYPAAYRLPNIISVAATDIRNNLLPSSNWGKTVDVAAPGENIYSTLPNGRYGTMTGTSQATAFVTGVAALLLSKDPNLTPPQIRQIIMNSVDKISGLNGKTATAGRVNAYNALLQLRTKNPIALVKPIARRPVSLMDQMIERPGFEN